MTSSRMSKIILVARLVCEKGGGQCRGKSGIKSKTFCNAGGSVWSSCSPCDPLWHQCMELVPDHFIFAILLIGPAIARRARSPATLDKRRVLKENHICCRRRKKGGGDRVDLGGKTFCSEALGSSSSALKKEGAGSEWSRSENKKLSGIEIAFSRKQDGKA